jgi:hypothetical protein
VLVIIAVAIWGAGGRFAAPQAKDA